MRSVNWAATGRESRSRRPDWPKLMFPSRQGPASNALTSAIFVIADLGSCRHPRRECGFALFLQGLPKASINFTVQRGQALDLARQFVGKLHQDVAGYQSSIVFSVDDNTKTYLERNRRTRAGEPSDLDPGECLVLGGAFLPVRSRRKSTACGSARMDTLSGMTMWIEEARAGAHLERVDAQSRAEEFLRADYGADLSSYELLPEEVNSAERPARRDWSFTWQRRDFHVPAGPPELPTNCASPCKAMPSAARRNF